MKYYGETAIVTGAGKGIGYAIACALAKEGIKVGVLALHKESADEAAKKIVNVGGNAKPLVADVSDQEMVNKAVKSFVDEFGPIDIMINNAAAPAEHVLFNETNDRIQHDELVTFIGTLNCTRAVINSMIERRYGRIINISSVGANFGAAGRAIYCAANAAINCFTKGLAHEVGCYNITVNAISPGATESPRFKARSKKVRDDHLEMIALPRFGEPEDIANGVLFLLQNSSSYITGALIDIDGGFCGYKPVKGI